jgi:hypothetical protein
MFLALSQNLGCHIYNADYEEETSVTQWVINQYSDFLSFMGYTMAFHETSASVVAGTCGRIVGIAVYLNCELLLLEAKIRDPRFYVT